LSADERELDLLLATLEDHLDADRCNSTDELYRKTLTYDDIDRPPLVIGCPFGGTLDMPAPWDRFRCYGYREAFDDPVAMLQNALLGSVVPGLVLGDDSPLAIRNENGTIQIGSILGGRWKMHEDNYPWMEPFGDIDAIEQIAYSDIPDAGNSVLPRSLMTVELYREKLAQFPMCQAVIQISLPDLQGPMDTAEMLWGSGIYYAFADHPELLDALLAKIVDTMLAVSKQYRDLATDRLDPFANTQHGYVIPGRLLIRNDSSIMLSPDTYAEFIRPHDSRLLKEIGTGSIHSCGNWQHIVSRVLEIPDLHGMDFGDPAMMDIKSVYGAARERKVALSNLHPSREDLVSGKARRDFPTGVVFTYLTQSLEDAREVVEEYRSTRRPSR